MVICLINTFSLVIVLCLCWFLFPISCAHPQAVFCSHGRLSYIFQEEEKCVPRIPSCIGQRWKCYGIRISFAKWVRCSLSYIWTFPKCGTANSPAVPVGWRGLCSQLAQWTCRMGDGILLSCAATPCQSWGQDMGSFYSHLRIFFNTDLGVKLLSLYYVSCGHCWIDIHTFWCWCWLMCKWPNLLQRPSKSFVQKQVSTPAVLWWCALAACVTHLGFWAFRDTEGHAAVTIEGFCSYLNHGPCWWEQG